MEPMNIKEAMDWSKTTEEYLQNDIDDLKYISQNRALMVQDKNDDTWGYALMMYDLVTSNWQSWEPPREYIGYWEAMVSILLDKKKFKVEIEDLEQSVFHEKDGIVVFSDNIVFNAILIPRPEVMSAKWYIDPDPNPDPSPASQEPCAMTEKIDGLTVYGSDEPGNNISPNIPSVEPQLAIMGMSWIKNTDSTDESHEEQSRTISKGYDISSDMEFKPVFDLTYEEARKACLDNPGTKVASEGWAADEYVTFCDDVWVDQCDDTIDESHAFCMKMFRVIK